MPFSPTTISPPQSNRSHHHQPIPEQLQAAVDSVLFGLKNLQLPERMAGTSTTTMTTIHDDPLVDNVRSTLQLYQNRISEEDFIQQLESWVHLEETDMYVREILQYEKEECLSIEEEHYCEMIQSIQRALSDPRYHTAVEYLQRARQEIMRSVKWKRHHHPNMMMMKREPEIM